MSSCSLSPAMAAAVTLGLANGNVGRERLGRDDMEALMAATELEQQMRMFGVWQARVDGSRGRSP